MVRKTYLAIIFICGGSSWATSSDDIYVAVARCKEICEKDWGSVVEFDGRQQEVYLYDISNEPDGWYADHRGVTGKTSKKLLPRLGKRLVVLENKKRKRG